MSQTLPESGSFVPCPECSATDFHIETRTAEYALVCRNGHQLRLFYTLTQPPVPPPPVRSQASVYSRSPHRES